MQHKNRYEWCFLAAKKYTEIIKMKINVMYMLTGFAALSLSISAFAARPSSGSDGLLNNFDN
ncbi:MAG: hypothetical protein ACRC55_10150, partial [Plesiomonas sp.]